MEVKHENPFQLPLISVLVYFYPLSNFLLLEKFNVQFQEQCVRQVLPEMDFL